MGSGGVATGGRSMHYRLALITQDQRLKKVVKRVSGHFGCELSSYKNCGDFVDDLASYQNGVIVIDGSICSQPRMMDLQLVLNEAPAWRVLYLPRTSKKEEIKEAMGLGTYGCLHKPVSEQEVRQMVESALGI
jgi:FixJ family two-component response regulator